MFRRFSTNFAVVSILLDVLFVVLGLATAASGVSSVRLAGGLAFSFTGQAPYNFAGWKYAVFPLLWVACLHLFTMYDGRRNLRLVDEMTTLTMGSALAMISLSGVLFLTARETARSLFLVFVLSAFVYSAAWRMAARIYLRVFPQAVKNRHLLILGAGVTGRKMEQRIQEWSERGFELVGFLDDDPLKQASDEQVLGPLSATVETVCSLHVEEVIMALPSTAASRINQMVVALHELPVKVWVIPDYYIMAVNKAGLDDVAGLPMIDLRAPVLDEYQLLTKRIFDIVVSILLLPVILPVMALVALMIHLDSPGPVFFRSKRIGENGCTFWMYKFRSMYQGAENHNHVIERVGENGKIIQEKSAVDPRVTRVGRILRRTSLDELPQIINVLRGEMSLIGPRPEMPHLVDQYESWQRRRFGVPQGITGWWQVNGRSDRPMHQHTEDDLFYVQHYSIWLDIQILVKTAWIILRGKGAY